MDHLGWSRVQSALFGGGAIALLGVLPAFSDAMIDLLDLLAGQFLLITGGLLLCVFTGWIMRNPIEEARKGAEHWPGYRLWLWILRFPVPDLLAFVLFFIGRQLVAQIAGLLGLSGS
jgi:SNF family Na+-dependent transporter